MDEETLQFLAELEREEVANRNDSLVPPGERPCPICGVKMQVEIERGIHVDACAQHGVWLDRGELPRIISKIRSGERANRQRLIRDARKDGKKSGAIFGVWSLWME